MTKIFCLGCNEVIEPCLKTDRVTTFFHGFDIDTTRHTQENDGG